MTSFFWFMANLEQCESRISGAWSIKLTFSLTPSKHSSWWRRLEDAFRLRLQETSSRRLDQDEYVRLGLTSSRHLCQDQYIRLGHTSSRRFEDVLQKRLQDIFKTFWRRFEDVLQRYLQDVFKTYHQVTVLVNTSLRSIQHVSETFFSKDDYLQKNMPR